MNVPSPSQPSGLAFFDFDNTIIHGDAGPLFGKYLYRARRDDLRRKTRLPAAGLWLRYAPYVSWMVVQAGLYKVGARRRSSIIRSAYRGLRGVPVAHFHGLIGDVVTATIAPRIYPAMLEEIRRHKAAGRICVIVTTGMEPLVSRVLTHLPDGVELIGCRLRESNGKLTGHVDGPLFGLDKANIIHAYARARGIDPQACWAYSDHWSDIQMLEAVGHPVVVNPRGRLLRHAQQHGWRIMEPKVPAGD